HALATLRPGERPVLHTDRGAHYRWPGWLQRVEAAGLVRSMSRKACTADNAACEGFFGRIKSEMFYGRFWRGVSVRQFIEILDDYSSLVQSTSHQDVSRRDESDGVS